VSGKTSGEGQTSYVSVDVLALHFDHQAREVVLGVHHRPLPPYEGELALPGVLLLRGERLREAGARALAKIAISATAVRAQGQLITFDEPNRDPRGPTLSIALWAVVDHLSPDADWVGLDRVPPLAFDHQRIVGDCRPLLAGLLWRDLAFSRALTGHSFAAIDARDLTASLTGVEPDRGNLNRTLAGLAGLTRTDQRRPSATGTGRPGVVWAWG
jgi:8-oxo-dGTP diphosphatase